MTCRCTCHAAHFSRAACPHCYPLVLFCGSRTWADQRRTDSIMERLFSLFAGRFHVIQGGAPGADDCSWLAAKKLNVPVETERANWRRDGRRAGILRNIRMLDRQPQYVVALWDGMSRGTYYTIDHAINVYRIPTMVVRATR